MLAINSPKFNNINLNFSIFSYLKFIHQNLRKTWRTDTFFTKYFCLPEEFYFSCFVAMGLSFTGYLEAVWAWKKLGCIKCLATRVSWDMGLLTVCVCTSANLGTPSIIQQIMSFAVLIFSWFSHFLKLPFACLKKP